MPFNANEFFDVFAAYNQALWPFAAVLWLITSLIGVAFVLGASMPAPLPRVLLAAHWLWAGLVYHAWFFTAINPAAWSFAALFVAQGVLLIGFKSSDRQAVDWVGSPRRVVSSLLIVYSLIYPGVVWVDGFAYPRMPTFGVPCPTVLLTIGVLLATPRHEKAVFRLCVYLSSQEAERVVRALARIARRDFEGGWAGTGIQSDSATGHHGGATWTDRDFSGGGNRRHR